MGKTALVIVDLQNDYFPGGRWTLNGIESAATAAAKIISQFRAKGLPVIHVRHEFSSPDAPFFRPGSEGARIHESVSPKGDEPVILKNFANSFRNTSLKEHLDRAGVEEIVVCGAMSHMCIDATVRAASDLGYRCTVVQDACATRDLEFNGISVPARQVHAAFMAALGAAYAKVVATADLMRDMA